MAQNDKNTMSLREAAAEIERKNHEAQQAYLVRRKEELKEQLQANYSSFLNTFPGLLEMMQADGITIEPTIIDQEAVIKCFNTDREVHIRFVFSNRNDDVWNFFYAESELLEESYSIWRKEPEQDLEAAIQIFSRLFFDPNRKPKKRLVQELAPTPPKVDTGGPAFPTPIASAYSDNSSYHESENEGISVRDYFAAKAPNEVPSWFMPQPSFSQSNGQENDTILMIDAVNAWNSMANQEKRFFAWRWYYANTMLQTRKEG
jgi:hypothetical protein